MEGLELVKFDLKKRDDIWIKLMKYGEKLGCHQMPERSFFISGYQCPVCARCSGAMVSEVVAIICILVGFKIQLWISLILIAIMGFDWLIQYLKIIKSNNFNRFITGCCRRIRINIYILLCYHIYYWDLLEQFREAIVNSLFFEYALYIFWH